MDKFLEWTRPLQVCYTGLVKRPARRCRRGRPSRGWRKGLTS